MMEYIQIILAMIIYGGACAYLGYKIGREK